MNKKYLYKLEYDKVLNKLSNYAKTYISKNMCFNLVPSNKKEEVIKLQANIRDALKLYNFQGFPDIYSISEISLWEKPLESYSVLSAKALLEIAYILKMSRNFKEYYYSAKDNTTFETLEDMLSNIYVNSSIEKKILNAILDENNISDNASSNLATIRRKQKGLEQEIKAKLNNFIHSSTYSKYIQDAIVTIRNDRFVIPVKGEYRSSIKGFVHDISSSGSTVFIEPTEVFEINNQINTLKLEENIEIEKILKDLSIQLFPLVKELKNNVNIIAKLDFIFAKALYAISINATEPVISNSKEINLLKARHPLIDEEKIVPIDIYVGTKFNTLVITGPNTGGKTVALKTVGLLVLMACSGLNIPAAENSQVFVADNIFADIGDDQNITESLSTFSAHMLNIIEITKVATKDSLVLLDELGSGTDPEEGSSLAISVLKFLNELKCITIATTHYPEIKNYAIVEENFENASCEFDLENLKPTYKLLMGIPGKSNAFEISKKLGLDASILSTARGFISDDKIDIETLLNNIYQDRATIEKEKENILKNSNQIEMLRKSLETEYNDIYSKKQDLIQKAKIEARDILIEAKENANEILKEMNKIKLNQSKEATRELNKLRDSLNEDISKIELIQKESNSHLKPIEQDKIFIGMEVFDKKINQVATIISLPNKEQKLQIQVGIMKLNTEVKNLYYANTKKEMKAKTSVSINKSKQVSSEINVIGLTADEALYMLDKYLDDCSLSSLPTVTIIHGRGAGILKNAIRKYLRNNVHVKSFRPGMYGEGEDGVTVVEMRN